MVINLWGAPVGDPSVKKSPAASEGTKPLERLKAAAIERHKQASKDFLADAMMNENDADVLKKKVKKMQSDGASREELRAFIAKAEIEQNAAPVLKTYSVQDSTIEALTRVWKTIRAAFSFTATS